MDGRSAAIRFSHDGCRKQFAHKERYYLGMVTREEELARLEEHLLWCHSCVERAEETQDYVDTIRVASLSFED